jgi:predicted aconitase|uniref:Phosphomevalonate dehydratase large subunit n=1 Tax=Ignisphaera aggregans TaxID=334771 RepID=A0A7J2U441_9CREN
MYLTRIEEKMFSGEYGEVVEKAIRVIVKVGEALGAERLVKISHAHISGVSYFNIGDEGLELLEGFSNRGAMVSIYTTANPYSFAGLGLYKDDELIRKQAKIIESLIRIGVDPNSFTCTPYKLRKPFVEEHLAWAESSAVIYANTIFGARTNREGGLIALMAALIGRTYYAGMHKLENRRASEIIVTLFDVDSILVASLLGLYIGRIVHDIPYIRARYRAENEAMHDIMIRNTLASIATTSDLPMAVLEGVTPQSTYVMEKDETISVDMKELENIDIKCSSDVLLLGCPHITLDELEILLKDKQLNLLKKHGISKIIVTVPKYNEKSSEIFKLVQKVRERYSIEIQILPGACAVVSNLKALGFTAIATPHGKALHYLQNLAGAKPCAIHV